MSRTLALWVLVCAYGVQLSAQSLGNAGTIQGTVVDPSGAAVVGASVSIHNALTGYERTTPSDTDGTFRFNNVPANPYHLEVKAPGFDTFSEDVIIRGGVPVQVKASLALAGAKSAVTVEAAGADMLEVNPSVHADADRTLLSKLPLEDPGGGLSQAIVYSTGGVAADANGFFHPLGDHAQVSFVIDGQPISDQQSKLYSTQLPTSAIQSMEAVTGTPAAEFGDKTSLVANITTRSGLGAGRVFGNLGASYGSFGTAGGSAAVGFGNARIGNFLTVDGTRSGRFLDTPEFTAFHDKGNNASIFDRFDYQPSGHDAFHLNLFTARNWFQIPNAYDSLDEDQHERVLTWSVAPGYQHTFNAHMLLTVNPYIRKDQVNYYASRNLFADSPSTQSQARQLLNWGVKGDLSLNYGAHTVKLGLDLKQTRLLENFGFGITDPNYAVSPGLLPFDLARGGRLFAFHATGNVNQIAGYAQDAITAGNFQFNAGVRIERYDGLASSNGLEPRGGIAYHVKKTGTVLRTAYARTLETPFNENLLLSSATGPGGLAENVFGASSVPLSPGHRNQFNAGFQQAIGRYFVADVDYFWKYTHNAYDFSTLLDTTITFPISWHNSKLDGVTGSVRSTNLRGFQAYWTFGHTRARYFFPEVGGLISQGTPLDGGVFRIDHDQAFQSTAVLRYQHKNAEWVSWTWRYDSGLVVSGVPDADAALALTPNQQATIGLSCGGLVATYTNGGLSRELCGANPVRSTLLALPQAGQENDDHHPDRVKPRHVFNVAMGTDNLWHTEKNAKVTASVEITNLTNEVALYNFLSTFSGTHFLEPRAVVARVGVVF